MGQRRMYRAHKDNCLQCCLCYILDVDLTEVLDVSSLPVQMHKEWFNFLNEYLLDNYERVLVPIRGAVCETVEYLIDIRQDHDMNTHAVVTNPEGDILWDPNPTPKIYDKTLVRLVLL